MKQATFFNAFYCLLHFMIRIWHVKRMVGEGSPRTFIQLYDIIDVTWFLDSFSALRLGRPAYFAQLQQEEVSCYCHCSILQEFQFVYCVLCGNYNIDGFSILLESCEYFVGRDRIWRFCCCCSSGSIQLRRMFFANMRRTTLFRWSRIQWKKWRLVPWVDTTLSKLFLSKVKL